MSSQQLRISSDLYDKTVKASHSLTNTVKSYANDSSIGLYRVQEHIHKRTPTAVRERTKEKQFQQNELDVAVATAQDNLNDLKALAGTIQQLEQMQQRLNNIHSYASKDN
ncbi:hypothetical protein MP228_008497 [Amoeboaphelidium protococcarum]|nr:hypothetical protein MP228_008497 [Amoeboaphelidium protococcarum]